MKSLPRITKILKIEPFKILLLWNNAEVREIDFTPLFQKWEKERNYKYFTTDGILDFEKWQINTLKILFLYNPTKFYVPVISFIVLMYLL